MSERAQDMLLLGDPISHAAGGVTFANANTQYLSTGATGADSWGNTIKVGDSPIRFVTIYNGDAVAVLYVTFGSVNKDARTPDAGSFPVLPGERMTFPFKRLPDGDQPCIRTITSTGTIAGSINWHR
jgi:hypothetical protein